MAELKVYRGHIRNWEELLDELGINRKSLPFTLTESGEEIPERAAREKEILIRGYEKWGHSMMDHLYGMFAFAIYDENKNELFAARDHFGTKPFYYYLTKDSELLYGTFIRDILGKPGFVKELNKNMLQIYLTLSYPGGEDTFFKGIKKLMPGHYLVYRKKHEKTEGDDLSDCRSMRQSENNLKDYSDGDMRHEHGKDAEIVITRYWTPQFRPDDSRPLEAYANEIHETLARIMPETLDASESAESFLSGGVDSSYVFAMSKADTADTCGYEEERFDESRLACETAKLLNKNINRAIIQPEEFFAAVPYVMENMELPLGDASAIVFALGCRAAAEHTKICYSGEGSDEFFGGYNMYRNAERYGDNLKTFYVGNTNLMKEEDKQRLLKEYDPAVLPINLVKHIYDEIEEYDPLTKMSDIDIQLWLEGDIYLNVDKMSEAAGLEVRMPLTDRRIFDIASRMPSEYKVTEEQNKVAFRMAAAKVLPDEIAFRKKLGFIVPIRIWMADDRYNSSVRETIFNKSAEEFFNKEEIHAIWDAYKGGDSDLWRKIWVIYTFLVWYDIYFS